MLQTEVLPHINPDFVLLQWYVNDVEHSGARTNSPAGHIHEGARDRVNEFKQMMLNQSVIYFLAADAYHRVRTMMGMGPAEELAARLGAPSSQDVRNAEQAMIQFMRSSKEKNVPVGVFLIPDLAPLGEKPYPFADLHHRVGEWCQQEAVPCVDLFPVFEPYLRDPTKYVDLWVNRFDSHMGPLANQLAATRLLEVFGHILVPDHMPAPAR